MNHNLFESQSQKEHKPQVQHEIKMLHLQLTEICLFGIDGHETSAQLHIIDDNQGFYSKILQSAANVAYTVHIDAERNIGVALSC